jgi:hypothetical protein
MFTRATLAILFCIAFTRVVAAEPPKDFPQFIVPGHEAEMRSLRALFWLHYEPAGPLIPLWDEWMPMSTLWPASTARKTNSMRARWARALARRPMNAEGYVLTQQHDGPAHAEGWPFPFWAHAGGVGWHFRGTGISGYEPPIASPEGWVLTDGKRGEVNDKGWVATLTNAHATLQSPGFAIEAAKMPWLRLNWWANSLENANCFVEWTTRDKPEFNRERRMYFSPALADGQTNSGLPMAPKFTVELNTSVGETRTMIPVHKHPGWKGIITGFRIHFDNRGLASLVIKSFHTACDTRQTVNNMNFIRGCKEYFLWTGDISFLRGQIGRMRTAMHYVMNEFDTRRRKCIYTTWLGHEGRSGVRWYKGNKTIVAGEGIGGNYWDLLPFGGEDALATIYYYDAVLDLADVEEAIRKHPEWNVSSGAEALGTVDLRQHAREVKDYGTKRFWNSDTGRFGTVDMDGRMHDYGFTFLNNEAIYYGFATAEQAQTIRAWISGTRIVEGDTSTGPDIYHWRFGPRSTTRRNLDYYYWGWSAPESIPWGYQVQDGGAVLGFSYHDLMARLKVHGPDDVSQRLKEILKWFDETQAAGGYREYYKDGSRGSMQGGNTAGGLGLDKEFFESVMVPQVMIYGFLGLQPTVDGLLLDPKLPKDWPELTITRIRFREHVLNITAREKTVKIESSTKSDEPLILGLPKGWTFTNASPDGLKVRLKL